MVTVILLCYFLHPEKYEEQPTHQLFCCVIVVLCYFAVNVKLKLIYDFFHSQYEFGDIIAFPRQKCSCEEPIYYHYAIYVGKQPIDGKQPGQDIFHHSGMCG